MPNAAVPATEPTRDQLSALIALYKQGQYLEVMASGQALAAQYPDAVAVHNILGAANAGLGKHEQAVASYARALQIAPDFAQAHSNLGNTLRALGKFEPAIASLREALRIKPNYAQAHNNLGKALMALGRHGDAIASYGRAVRIKPEFTEAHNNLGNALNDLGEHERAAASLREALRIDSSHASAHNNLGIALNGLGRHDEAIACYNDALRIDPTLAEAQANLGNAFKDLGRHGKAIASYTRALRIKPDSAEIRNNLGIVLNGLGRHDEAAASFAEAVRIKPDYAQAHSNLGNALDNLGRQDEAIASLLTALRIEPGFSEAYGNLCEIYEKTNRIAELEETLNDARRDCAKDDPNVLIWSANLSLRKKEYSDALACLEEIDQKKLNPNLRTLCFAIRGKVYERLNLFEKAIRQFEKQNEEMAELSRLSQRHAPEARFNSIVELGKAWNSDASVNWPAAAPRADNAAPVFVIGFPRSGTTLLDTVLRGHPGIAVVEEKDMAAKMLSRFGRFPSIGNLNRVTDFERHTLREAYYTELAAHLGDGGRDKLAIDKLPLNICHVGLIHRVFPDARFILALRHPCDCVLSCFMQNFKLNDAMANFLTLEQSARFYVAVMELWLAYRERLKPDAVELRYEDLVRDMRGTCRTLIEFLGLAWDDRMLSYRETAMSRGRINTPSYNQVVQPLYSQSIGRWENYREQMQPVLPLLEPWISEFGY